LGHCGYRRLQGNIAVWLLNGLQIANSGTLGQGPSDWLVAETGDFDGDGKSDILWRNTTTGDTAIWFLRGTRVTSTASLGTVDLGWTIQGLNAD
jgi:hypothetical protein